MKETNVYKMEGSEELIDDIPEKCIGADVLIYDYHCEDYEGRGTLLVRKNGKWYEKDLSHCSCYGPLEELAVSMKTPAGYSIICIMEKTSNEQTKV